MNNGYPPIIRLELEGMKASIVHALADRNAEISKLVEAQIDHAVKNFDFEKAVRAATEEALAEAVKRYFRLGEGSRTIDQAVKLAFREAMTPQSAEGGE